jgi:3-methyl-2-oxobutanoate hydroxymethyltransferase
MTSSTPLKVSVPALRARKASRDGESTRIAALTAYDFTMARILDQGGVDVVLVGDSLGMVVQGEDTTLPVTLEQMIYHTRCVSRGVSRALVVADMPFLSYQISQERAIESAGRLLKEGGAEAVKIEGGVAIADTIARLVALDIPVMGHVGMTPQSVHRMGGFKQQGRSNRDEATFAPGTREQIIEDAKAVEAAGAYSIVLEGVPSDVARVITAEVSIPTIGIAAGSACDGEILVSYDLFGFTLDRCPPFLKDGATLGTSAVEAVQRFKDKVQNTVRNQRVAALS